MIEAKPYPEEDKRLEAVQSLGLLDMPIEERFESITRMVCRMLDVPIALFNLLDKDRQHYKSAQGLPNTDASLPGAFCTHAIHEQNMLLIPNTSKDERFHDNPFVTGENLNIGFYAGCPIRSPNGMPVGTLCAIDLKPRDMTPEQLATLRDLAAMIENELKVPYVSNAQKALTAGLDDKARIGLVDPVSRVWNRDGITNILEREIAEAHSKQTSRAVILVTLDQFQNIKSLFGQQIADGILRTLGKKLLQAFLIDDSIGRLEGATFMVVVQKAPTSPAPFIDAVARLRQLMASDSFIAGMNKKHPMNLCFGIATMTRGEKASDLAVRANKALQQAQTSKSDGLEFAK